MRTLLVDNYDSFTYNLFHYLAEVNGREPEVVVNDDPAWQYTRLDEFDNVVISPGPGNPERPADFGICREILQRGHLPTLGVCLGHQGLAALHGGRVSRAPEPYHGRVCSVVHDGTELFAGLPSPFEVVRYHSLAVDRLSPDLVATAWTEDGVLMGLRHRERPQWGVQFHPESISGQYGHRLLANFRDLTEEHARRTGRRLRPARPVLPVPDLRFAPQRQLKLLVEELPTRWEDEVAYDRLFRGGPHAYWLDSSRPDADRGRFSIMGDASGPLGRVATADAWNSTVLVRDASGAEVVSGTFLDWLDQDLRQTAVDTPELPFDFALGWVGYLGYELKAECGGDRTHRSDLPDAAMVFSGRALVLDHATDTTYLLALAEEGDEDGARAWLADAAERLARAVRSGLRLTAQPMPLGRIEARHDRQEYLDLIARCQEEIAAGETYEVCLTNMLRVDGEMDPWEGYRYLRRVNPAPFAALLQFGGVSVLSSSPERFLKVDRSRRAESRPIKGSRPRGATHREDRALAEDLLTNEKDRAENLMIVDLVRNDLGRVAEVGSVEADDVFRVETFAKAHQLVSTVRATLRADHTSVDCVRAAFPPGSMTGAPKRRTMQIIDRLEQGPRGVYSGAIGWFSPNGACDLSVVIRTAVVTKGRIRYGVGGAVIALSDAEAEYQETVMKAAPVIALTGGEFPVGRARTDGARRTAAAAGAVPEGAARQTEAVRTEPVRTGPVRQAEPVRIPVG
ncbi:aminodeoxychorismate synthase component I [Kitasatospora paracochleata]|uniref:aminodeoxychorismate synthase n=1 Tax=Kitasatospora paracochleata TaxID=58354 RepID=A0ABT1J7E3_9ACTN|nr:aminodeoxychorismate synthase component I [Kitasatospora paracochleata]MCP2313356.1 para-aminobenzoate synthetase [Kitasatospora paracochleata]